MADMDSGVICKRAMVESNPQITKINGEPTELIIHVRYRSKDTIFPVEAKHDDMHFDELLQLRPGDEMYVSYDGETMCDIKRNPWWKRAWLWLTWSF